MTNRLITSLFLVFGALSSHQSHATSARFWLRTPNSSAKDYANYTTEHRYLTYVDWILFSLKNKKAQSVSLDKALEISVIDPFSSLSIFEKVILEIQSEILSANDRQLLTSLYLKIASLDLPTRIQENYQGLAKSLEILHRSGQTSKVKGGAEINQRDLALTMNQLSKIKGLEDSVVLVNGDPILRVSQHNWPVGPQQWALISNSFEPLIYVGTWNEFQKVLNQTEFNKPLASGDCGKLQILSDNYDLQTSAGIFFSRSCASDPIANASSGYRIDHLGDVTHELEPEKKWSWVLPVAAVAGVALAYSLKDKKVSVGIPSLR
jgi:hypothetical protein